MIVGDHDVSTETPSNDLAAVIFNFKDDFEALFFFVVATVAGYSGWQGTCSGCKIDYFRTIEDYYFLVFVSW
jgi:hypothetical protein